MIKRVTGNGDVSETFAVTNGVKQCCVLEPTLFSVMFSPILTDAYRDERPGIRIAYRSNGHLLNHLMMYFQLGASATSVHEILCANDCALDATSEGDMQRGMDVFDADCENFGLIINTERRVVMHRLLSNTAHNAPQISVNGTQLQVVDNFIYLRVTLSCSTKIDDEVARRISKANQTFGSQQNTV
ncbi:hypothetical protein SprV_0100314000 [Sparganum proliferum]